MKNGNYTIKEFLTFHSLDQILIPEIQRDYVWETENVNSLLQSIYEDFRAQVERIGLSTEQLTQGIPTIYAAEWAKFIQSQKKTTNIGFLYAYFDPEQYTKYILIDGQQRLTTIFLILLNLYIKEGRASVFKRNYFQNLIPKIDYKVRRSSHEFFLNFLDYILEGNELCNVTKQFWFHISFYNDPTINSLIQNYTAINNTLAEWNLTSDYLENQVEFWYFDTSQSEQGEDLYLYMNSRGERVQANENIKAQLLENLSDDNKNKWGNTWEKWQNFFWLNRGNSVNADRGFNDFLRWIVIINQIRQPQYNESMDMSERIRVIIDSEKFSLEGLQLGAISSYFEAVQRLLTTAGIDRYIDHSIFNQKPTQQLYIRLFPSIMYAEHYPDASSIELLRVVRFFFNITRFDLVSKSPLRFAGQCIHLMRELLENEFKDITDLMRFRDGERFEHIITDEELQKLFLYNTQPDENSRRDLEALIWEAEDFEMCDGKIILLWNCMKFYPFVKDHDEFVKENFIVVFDTFKMLFSRRTDLLRRALLCHGDYTFLDGTSTNLNAYRYSICQTKQDWLKIFEGEQSQKFVISLIKEALGHLAENPKLSDSQVLNKIIKSYIAGNPEKSWRYYFIKKPQILKYCGAKLFCYDGEDLAKITLLQGKKAIENSYISLDIYLKTIQ